MREMKNSGIEWIGEIPNEWLVGRVKYIFTRKNEKAMQEDPIILSLTRSGVRVRDMSNNDGQIAESYYNYNPVIPGDFLLNPMDLYSGANCNVSYVYGVISPAYINLRAKGQNSARYFDYFFKNQYWAMAMFAHGKGVSFDNRWTISAETLLNYSIPLPSIDEQKKIADFLDEKCAEINTVIEKTKATIEEYKKLKQSVITQAVTKGIRPNRPMKDSGIEWIGEVPADWNVVKASRLVVSTQNGLSRRDLEKSDGQIVLKLKNISPDGKISYSEINRIELTNKEIETYSLEDGDFLFVRVNGSKNLVGKCAIYKDISEIVAYNDHIIRVRLNEICNKRYFQYYLQSSSGKTEIDLHTSTAAGQFTISGEGLRDLYIVLPSNYEQNELADYLDKKCSKIDELITKKTSLLSELESYKKSLIYEYVTGKKEV